MSYLKLREYVEWEGIITRKNIFTRHDRGHPYLFSYLCNLSFASLRLKDFRQIVR